MGLSTVYFCPRATAIGRGESQAVWVLLSISGLEVRRHELGRGCLHQCGAHRELCLHLALLSSTHLELLLQGHECELQICLRRGRVGEKLGPEGAPHHRDSSGHHVVCVKDHHSALFAFVLEYCWFLYMVPHVMAQGNHN